MMANTWQGEFPWQNLRTDGFPGTSPVKSFPPNGYGLYDMAGNVWEWTSDFYTTRLHGEPTTPCCAPHNPRAASPEASLVADQPGAHIPRRVIKGGSHLCAPNYCLRYRPAARQARRSTPRPPTSASAASSADPFGAAGLLHHLVGSAKTAFQSRLMLMTVHPCSAACSNDASAPAV